MIKFDNVINSPEEHMAHVNKMRTDVAMVMINEGKCEMSRLEERASKHKHDCNTENGLNCDCGAWEATAELAQLNTANVNFANQVIQLLTEQTQLSADLDAWKLAFEIQKIAHDIRKAFLSATQKRAKEAKNLLNACLPHVVAMVGVASAARGLPEEITEWLAEEKK